jgi:hypothetical protein
MPLLATGGGDGTLRLYNIGSAVFSRPIATRGLNDDPILSVVFTHRTIAAASSGGLHFASLANAEVLGTLEVDDPILSLAYLARPNLVAVACRGREFLLVSPDDRRVFRSYSLSITTYPLLVAAHPTDLLVILAMNDATVVAVDVVSGEKVCQFQTLAGIITRILFHDGDIILGSHSGFLMRWNLPGALRAELEKEPTAPPIPFELSDDENDGREQVRKSFIHHKDPPPEWVYQEGHADLVPDSIEESPEEDEPEQVAVEDGQFDAPRPKVTSEEASVDNFLRRSFVRQSRPSPSPAREMQELANALRETLALAMEQLAIRSDDKEVIEAQEELKLITSRMTPDGSEAETATRELAMRMDERTREIERELLESRARIANILEILSG